jgi:GNAT superfamily N-acetyltransferase
MSREKGFVRIVPFEPRHALAFRELNEQWIQANFEIEEADRIALTDPETSIIRAGGHILVAIGGGDTVGVCALLPHGKRCFELAKMAVDPKAQGNGIGSMLCHAAIKTAKEAGADRLFLESNTKLAAAIRLYRKLGFLETQGESSPYRRCNIQMEMRL